MIFAPLHSRLLKIILTLSIAVAMLTIFFSLPSQLTLAETAKAGEVFLFAGTNNCWATPDDGSTVFMSSGATAVQQAVDTAAASVTVKIAGSCVGVQGNGSLTQTVYISQSITLQGGYTHTNWLLSQPITYPTTLAADGGGRVIYVDSGVVTLDSLNILGGYSDNEGGGIYNQGTLTVTKTSVMGNTAVSAGAGILNIGDLIIDASTIAHNEGDGLASLSNNVRFINSTIAHNQGNGILNDGSTMLFMQTTIAHNLGYGVSTTNGGGTSFSNTLVAQNTGDNCHGVGDISTDHNLSDDASCPFNQGNDFNETAVSFGALTDNGGPTWTMALLPIVENDPALSGSDCNGGTITVDQRGIDRPWNLFFCNMGAYEYSGSPFIANDDAVSAIAEIGNTFNVFDNDTFVAPFASIPWVITNIISPSYGTLVYDGDGEFTYHSLPGIVGSDVFTYQVVAGPFTSTAAVHISIATLFSENPELSLDWVTSLSPKAVATADVNHDGFLDIALVEDGVQLILNQAGTLPSIPDWEANGASGANGVVWGDVDLDGDLDLAVAISGGANKIYQNNQGVMDPNPIWSSTDNDDTTDIAWGDINGDGWLDLMAGDKYGYRVYLNSNGTLSTTVESVPIDADQFALGDMNGDGLLDLAVGEGLDLNQTAVYLNTGGQFSQFPVWSYAFDTGLGLSSSDLEWADIDNDSDLDLVVANLNNGVHIFENVSDLLQPTPLFTSGDAALFIDVGDLNGDSFLDIVVDKPSFVCPPLPCVSKIQILLNNKGTFGEPLPWGLEGSNPAPLGSSIFADMDSDGVLDLLTIQDFLKRHSNVQPLPFIPRMAVMTPLYNIQRNKQVWGDVDGDGDLDLAMVGHQSGVYLNENRLLQSESTEFGPIANPTWVGPTDAYSAAWGDVNGDGRLDLAIGRDGTNHVYLNQGTALTTTISWQSYETPDTRDIAWGDVDGDGDLDLAAADVDALRLYINISGTLNISATWVVTDTTGHKQLNWGDINNDGNLDLVVTGDNNTQLYVNNNGVLNTAVAWQVEGGISLGLGDVDSDGDLDLAVSRNGPNAVYENINGNLQNQPLWTSLDSDSFKVKIEWVDINNDGYPELLSTRQNSFTYPGLTRLYENVGGDLEQTNNFYINDEHSNSSVVDIDGDGDRDIVVYRLPDLCIFCEGIMVYYNQSEKSVFLPKAGVGVDVSLSLFSDETTTFNGQTATTLAPADDYALAHIRTDRIIPISYTTSAPTGSVLQVRGKYSFNGGGDWLPALATSDTITIHTAFDGSPQVYKWDTFASGFFGQSDNVMFKLEVVSSGHGLNGVAAAQQRPYYSGQTNPFRVRGTQVRVLSGTAPIANAQIYRLPAGQTAGAELMVDDSGRPLRTNISGYLQGRGQIDIGDTLYAIVPISHTDHYTLYHTSGVPTESGLTGFVMTEPGEQLLVVSADNPFMLFNPIVSLEWDSRNDPTYLSQLTGDLKRTSELLFDVTNGQVALGQIRIYQAKENWVESHILIYAANNIHPSAVMGGVVDEPKNDFITATGVISDAYLPGQIHIGPTWSRFGDPDANLGEDWSRALAHEFGHFLLFLPDNYLGLENGNLISTDCYGSFMTNAYADEYSEFLTEPDWIGPCLQTIAEQVSGRNDWETITQFYPWMRSDTLLSGPSILPLAVTNIEFVEPASPATALQAPFFPLIDEFGEQMFVPNGDGAGYLIKNWDTATLEDDYVVSLGAPVGDQMQARGAAPDDRICVYNYNSAITHLGCDTVGQSESDLTLQALSNWQPQIEIEPQAITAVNQPITQTFGLHITVTQEITADLYVQIMPVAGFTSTFPITSTSAQLIPTDPLNPITFTQFLTLPYPTLEVFIRVWAEGLTPTREVMTQYSLGGGWGGNRIAWGGNRIAWGGNRIAWGGNRIAWGAPVASGNGQVIIFNVDDVFGDTGVASLQTLNVPPLLPTWMTPIGQAYRFESKDAFTRTISFNYLQTDVPGGNLYESFLQIYYSPDNGKTWQPLPTSLDPEDNLAVAVMPNDQQGNGVYILVSTILLPQLFEGWNLFAYPLPGSQTAVDIFASIWGSFTSVYHQAEDGSWQLYDATVIAEHPEFAAFLNDLTDISFSEVYWVYATESITPYIGLPARNNAELFTITTPPATYYGWVTPTETFVPTAGMVVTATINGQLCGEGVVTDSVNQDRLAYKLQIRADDGDGCGAIGETAVFYINGQIIQQDITWDNSQAWFQPLSKVTNQIFLPFISKP